mmetsp:Transcript_78250/g.253439  ORF Transcript_78250/g.253439 Transcript_78250/m.253439 type:complete len:237 (+) Transcript_78250:523-1233(+)
MPSARGVGPAERQTLHLRTVQGGPHCTPAGSAVVAGLRAGWPCGGGSGRGGPRGCPGAPQDARPHTGASGKGRGGPSTGSSSLRGGHSGLVRGRGGLPRHRQTSALQGCPAGGRVGPVAAGVCGPAPAQHRCGGCRGRTALGAEVGAAEEFLQQLGSCAPGGREALPGARGAAGSHEALPAASLRGRRGLPPRLREGPRPQVQEGQGRAGRDGRAALPCRALCPTWLRLHAARGTS